MPEADPLIRRIDDLLETMAHPQAAYVVRSRLDRVIVIAKMRLDGLSDAQSHAANCCRTTLGSIELAFAALRRRSEPFGDGWVSKLLATRQELQQLRSELVQLTSA